MRLGRVLDNLNPVGPTTVGFQVPVHTEVVLKKPPAGSGDLLRREVVAPPEEDDPSLDA